MADIDGTSGGETLVGTSGDDLIRGLGGNDVIDGVGGIDRLEGGTGDDVYFADNDDLVIEAAGEGYDTIYAKASFTLGAGQEIEVLDSFDRTQTIALSLTGNAFAQGLVGNAGSNILDGGGGTDVFYGLGGDDTYVVDSADDLVVEYSGDGSDRVRASASYALAAGSHVEVLEAFDQAGTGALNLTGNQLAQILTGNAGANLLYGGGGGDTYYGLGGDDTYFVGSGDIVNEAAGGGNDIVYAMASYTLAAGQEIEVLDVFGRSGTAALILTGNGFSQTLVGNNGANTLNGGGGTDIFYGLGGNDTYIVDSADDLVIEFFQDFGSDTVNTSVSYALHPDSHVETLQTSDQVGTAPINLTGNGFDQTIIGNRGNNVLDGGGGKDLFIGGRGDDTYVIDSQDDRVLDRDTDGGFDTIYTLGSYTHVNSFLIPNNFPGAGAPETTYIEVLSAIPSTTYRIDLNGAGRIDTIIGNAGVNVLQGAHELRGLGGDDTYFVFSTTVIVEDLGGGFDTVNTTSASYTLAAGLEIEVLGSSGTFINGNEFGQRVMGSQGSNVLDGKGGSDDLIGFKYNSNSSIFDTYAFSTALGPDNVDRIRDWNFDGINVRATANDRIALDDAIFTGIGTPGSFDANAFFAGTAAHDTDDRIIYDQATGNLYFDADGSGAQAQILFAYFKYDDFLNKAAPLLTAAEFLVI